MGLPIPAIYRAASELPFPIGTIAAVNRRRFKFYRPILSGAFSPQTAQSLQVRLLCRYGERCLPERRLLPCVSARWSEPRPRPLRRHGLLDRRHELAQREGFRQESELLVLRQALFEGVFRIT